ncbi:MAG TPA: regulatory protein RecX [Chloroflexi bacterium]|nr:regulatory protein RecX [Chloroflexota bacterium]
MAGKISALRFQKRNKDRVNVYIDGEFAFGLAAIEAAQLKVGQFLNDEDIARLNTRDEEEKAYERALNYLSYRPRSEMEVRRNLYKKDLDAEIIDRVIDRLAQANLLDDATFARYWVDNRVRFKPRGVRALRYELRQKGVSDTIIDQVLQDLDDEENARRAAEAGARRLGQLERRDFERKLKAYMARRGFSYEVIKPLIEDLWQATQDEGLSE